MSGNCQFCGTWRRGLHKDHIVPRSIGGSDDPSNWQYLCANCHEDKTYAERQTPEWKAAASARSTGIRWTAEQRQRQSQRQIGKKRGPNKARGRPLKPEHAAKVKAAWTPERREQARQRLLGKKFGKRAPEVGEKIRAALKGKIHAAEFREKHSAALRRWWAGKSPEWRSAFAKKRSDARWAKNIGQETFDWEGAES